MSHNKTRGKTTRLQWVIRILILVIFVTAIFFTVIKLMEINRNQQEIDEKNKEKEEITDDIGDIENELDRPVDEDYVKDHTGTVEPQG